MLHNSHWTPSRYRGSLMAAMTRGSVWSKHLSETLTIRIHIDTADIKTLCKSSPLTKLLSQR